MSWYRGTLLPQATWMADGLHEAGTVLAIRGLQHHRQASHTGLGTVGGGSLLLSPHPPFRCGGLHGGFVAFAYILFFYTLTCVRPDLLEFYIGVAMNMVPGMGPALVFVMDLESCCLVAFQLGRCFGLLGSALSAFLWKVGNCTVPSPTRGGFQGAATLW